MITTTRTKPNPQGKGKIGIVDDLRSYNPVYVKAKDNTQWLADYFTSMMVLSAKFGIKPVIGKNYYLYLKDHEWRLSLIEPEAWSSQCSGVYFAKCMLHKDMSWSLAPKADWCDDVLLVTTIKQIQEEFLRSINNEKLLINHLPYFANNLSYYQRLGANALSKSLRLSLDIKFGRNESRKLMGSDMIRKLITSNESLLSFIPQGASTFS